MSATNTFWVDTDSGTWGNASTLFLIDATDDEIAALAEMTDAEISAHAVEHGRKVT